MSKEVSTEKTKVWTTVATFPTFNEADVKREELLKTNEQVKVRLGNKGKLFRVKVWNTPEVKKKKGKKS